MADWVDSLVSSSSCYLCHGIPLADAMKLLAIGGGAPIPPDPEPPFNPAECIPPGIDGDFVGTNFECYGVGFYSDSMPAGGRGINESSSVTSLPSFFDADDFSAYSPNDPVNGLTEGQGWAGAYTARDTYAGLKDDDDFGSYSDSDDVDGLNGGAVGWNGKYVARETDL